MVDAPPHAELLGSAIRLLTTRWNISAATAIETLLQIADNLGLAVGDLAALVCAADHQQRVTGEARRSDQLLPTPVAS